MNLDLTPEQVADWFASASLRQLRKVQALLMQEGAEFSIGLSAEVEVYIQEPEKQ